jgi:cysteine sulfinate desulfinase/cysteine desulfurase-like protein
VEPSEVLLAVGMSEQEALSAVRLSFSIHNTPAGLERVFAAFRRAMDKLERL